VAALEAVLTGTTLNLGHGSALLLPHADWSLSDSMRLVFGGAFGIGAGVRGDGSLALQKRLRVVGEMTGAPRQCAHSRRR
jgi:hypothetical protein